MESNLTQIDPTHRINLSSISSSSDRTGLFIALFLLLLLFILISYLFYSFFSFKRCPRRRQNILQDNLIDNNLENKIIFDDNNDLINNDGEIILGHKSSFSDCGTSLRSSIRSHHINPNVKRSSSYKLYSQASNFLLTPRLSSQLTSTGDENMSTTIIVEPNDAHLANALSRSISKYYERKRKPKLKRRTHSCEDLMIQTQTKSKSLLHGTASLPMRQSLRLPDRQSRLYRRPTSQTSFRRKPTTIYELYKSDRMRIANLLVSDP